ncbi:MAG: hypothetical protein NTW82_10300 [Bacteroidia bacterium]|nr:hypothetical protein [Bacteroidia bacterium]
MKLSVKIALFVVFFVALGSILIALYMYNMQHKDLQKIKPDFVITAADLQKAFEDNDALATSKYVNKILEITGMIESVNTGKENILSVIIKTGSDFSSVICTFPLKADTTKFIVGDQVTIKGECSGFLMDVLLNNCVLIN